MMLVTIPTISGGPGSVSGALYACRVETLKKDG